VLSLRHSILTNIFASYSNTHTRTRRVIALRKSWLRGSLIMEVARGCASARREVTPLGEKDRARKLTTSQDN
jgi:hypothetical protein